MPGVDDWLNNPLDIIENITRANDFKESRNVSEYFKQKLNAPNALSWLPSLNDTPLHDIKPDTLVKYRCMVQDTYDPEFYLGVFEVVDKSTGKKSLKSGKYRDIAHCSPHQDINTESQLNRTLDRQTLYCVPVPGENEWTKQAFASKNRVHSVASSSSSRRVKRQHEDEMAIESDETGQMETDGGGDASSSKVESEVFKRTRAETTEGAGSHSLNFDLNFPLPGETGHPCLVKIYEDFDESVLVNDLYEFIGVLSADPSLAHFHENDSAGDSISDPFVNGIEEVNAHTPPPSLVPRLHVVLGQKLRHTNPMLPASLSDIEIYKDRHTCTELSGVRCRLLPVLEQALFGDSLAAEYFLCHLVSTVYSRRDVIALGKFALNLAGCQSKSEFTELFYKVVKEILTKSYMLPLTIANLNTLKFSPRKDYTANRLKSGVLQLSAGTHLVLDETAMEPGQLNADGVRNITALGNMIQWQKVEYDFNFHKQEFPCNLNVLVLSEGKSLLPCDYVCPIIPQASGASLVERFSGIHQLLTPALLTEIRSYIDIVRFMEYKLPDEVQKVIEEDFVEMRRQDPSHMTVEDFQSLLVLARLLALSHGQTSLSREFWERAKVMESERKMRMPSPTASVL